MNKPKLIVPKHVWDGAQAEKKKNEVEKNTTTIWLENGIIPTKITR